MMPTGSMWCNQHRSTALTSLQSRSRHSFVLNAELSAVARVAAGVCPQGPDKPLSRKAACHSLSGTSSNQTAPSTPASQHAIGLYQHVDITTNISLVQAIPQLTSVPTSQLPAALQQVEHHLAQLAAAQEQHISVNGNTVDQLLVTGPVHQSLEDGNRQLNVSSDHKLSIQAWCELLARLHRAGIAPGPQLLHHLYSTHPPGTLLKTTTPQEAASLLICVLQLTAAQPRIDPPHKQPQPGALRTHRQSSRSWIGRTLDVLLPHIGTSQLSSGKLVEVVRQLTTHPDPHLPNASFMSSLYSQMITQAAPSAHTADDQVGGACDSGQHGPETAQGFFRLPSDLSIALLQQLMWAISRLVVSKGAPPPDEHLLKVVQAHVIHSLSPAAATPVTPALVKPCKSVCISLAHLKAAGSVAVLQSVEHASAELLPQLPVVLQTEFLWAAAVLGYRPADTWVSSAVHYLHGASSIPNKNLVQSLWALSVILAAEPTPSQPQPASSSTGPLQPATTQSALAQDESATAVTNVARPRSQGVADRQLVQRLVPQIMERLHPQLYRLQGASLGTILSALAVLMPGAASKQLHPVCAQHAEFMDDLFRYCTAAVHSTSPHMAISMLWAASCLGYCVPRSHTLDQPDASNQAASTGSARGSSAGGEVRPAVLVQFVQAAAARAVSGVHETSATDHAALMTSLASLGWVTDLSWTHTAAQAFRPRLHLLQGDKLHKLLQGCGRAFTSSLPTRAHRQPANRPSKQPNHAKLLPGMKEAEATQELGSFLLACADRYLTCTGAPESAIPAGVHGQGGTSMQVAAAEQCHALHGVTEAAEGFAGLTSLYVCLVQQMASVQTHTSAAGQLSKQVEQVSRAAVQLSDVAQRLVEHLAAGLQPLLEPHTRQHQGHAPSPRSVVNALTAVLWLHHQAQRLHDAAEDLNRLQLDDAVVPAQPTSPSSVLQPATHLPPQQPAHQPTQSSLAQPMLQPPAARSMHALAGDVDGDASQVQQVQPLQQQLVRAYGDTLLLPSFATRALSKALQNSGSRSWQVIRMALQKSCTGLALSSISSTQHTAVDANVPAGSISVLAGLLQSHVVLGIAPAADLMAAMHTCFIPPGAAALSVPTVAAAVKLDQQGAAALLDSLQALHASGVAPGTGAVLAGGSGLSLEQVLLALSQTHSSNDSTATPDAEQSMPPQPNLSAQPSPSFQHATSTNTRPTAPAHDDQGAASVSSRLIHAVTASAAARLVNLVPDATLAQLIDLLHASARQGLTLSKEAGSAVMHALEQVQASSWAELDLSAACRLYWSMTVLGMHPCATSSIPLFDLHLTRLLTAGSVAAEQQSCQGDPQQLGGPVQEAAHVATETFDIDLLVSMMWCAAKRTDGGGSLVHNARRSASSTDVTGRTAPTINVPQESAQHVGDDTQQSGTAGSSWCRHVAEQLLARVSCDPCEVSLAHVCVMMWASSLLLTQAAGVTTSASPPSVLSSAAAAPSVLGSAAAGEQQQQQTLACLSSLYHVCQRRLFGVITPVVTQRHWLQSSRFSLTSASAPTEPSSPAPGNLMAELSSSNLMSAAEAVARMQADDKQAGVVPHFPEVLKLALAAGIKTASPRTVLSYLRFLAQWNIPLNKVLRMQIRARIHQLVAYPRQQANQLTATLSATDTLMLCKLLSKLGLKLPLPTRQQLCTSVLAQLPTCSPQRLARAVHALPGLLVVLEGPDAELLLSCVDKAIQSRELHSSHIASLLYDVAKLSSGQPWQPAAPLLQECCAALVPLLPTARPEEVAHVVWALAKLEFPPHAVFIDAVLSRTRTVMNQGGMGIYPLATILYSFAALGYRPPAAWLSDLYASTQAQLRAAGRSRRPAQHTAASRTQSIGPSMCRLMWAAAALRLNPPRAWTRRVIAAAGKDLANCWRHDLTLMAVGCALLGPPLSSSWLKAFYAAVKTQALVGGLDAKTQLMWAWQRLRERVQLDRQELLARREAGDGRGASRGGGRGIRLARKPAAPRVVLVRKRPRCATVAL